MPTNHSTVCAAKKERHEKGNGLKLGWLSVWEHSMLPGALFEDDIMLSVRQFRQKQQCYAWARFREHCSVPSHDRELDRTASTWGNTEVWSTHRQHCAKMEGKKWNRPQRSSGIQNLCQATCLKRNHNEIWELCVITFISNVIMVSHWECSGPVYNNTHFLCSYVLK